MRVQPRTVPGYEALTTLRHIGVPSSLLDWTHSTFVAACFAVCEANENDMTPVALFFFRNQPAETGSTAQRAVGHQSHH